MRKSDGHTVRNLTGHIHKKGRTMGRTTEGNYHDGEENNRKNKQ